MEQRSVDQRGVDHMSVDQRITETNMSYTESPMNELPHPGRVHHSSPSYITICDLSLCHHTLVLSAAYSLSDAGHECSDRRDRGHGRGD